MKEFDANYYSKEYPCFISVAGNPTLPGGCSSYINTPNMPSANNVPLDYKSTCLGPSKPIGYNNIDSSNPDPKTTVSTFFTLYKINLPLVFGSNGYTFTGGGVDPTALNRP